MADERRRLPLYVTPRADLGGPEQHAPAARVQIICMPYQHVGLSSLAIALLATTLREHGIAVTETYLHFGLARVLGPDRYMKVAAGSTRAGLVGELFFAEELHGTTGDERTEERLLPLFGPPAERAEKRAEFLRHCMARVYEAGADLIGFSTSCNQLLPALWLARHIKAAKPDVRIVFGGSSCSAPMGDQIIKGYEMVDHVVSGYGEEALIDLCLGGDTRSQRLITSERPVDMDTLPVPSYEAYFREIDASSLGVPNVMLTFESSRGCWWGEKMHCTFCGLNRLEMAYNSKSSARVVSEVRTLWERHHTALFATDSILSRSHLKEVIPALANYASRPTIFYEVKANMTRDEVVALRRANVVWIQPGIESLSTPLLKLIKKGVKAIQNLALLKWSRELGIMVSWNFLWGIPGEQPEDYEGQIRLMDLCAHLQPPQDAAAVRLDRYAPYFKDAASYGWSRLEPYEEYRLLHPHLGDAALFDIAYHFDGIGGPLGTDVYLSRVEAALSRWKAAHAKGEGQFWDSEIGLVRIKDDEGAVLRVTPQLSAIIEASNEIVPLSKLAAAAHGDTALIDHLVGLGVLYVEGNHALNLAACVGAPAPSRDRSGAHGFLGAAS